MFDSLQRAPVGVRVLANEGERAAVFGRSLRAVLEQGWSFDIGQPELTGAELRSEAPASDVIGAAPDALHREIPPLPRAAGIEAARQLSP